jgi:ribosomal protein S18 acetylase RimI-like enzyme
VGLLARLGDVHNDQRLKFGLLLTFNRLTVPDTPLHHMTATSSLIIRPMVDSDIDTVFDLSNRAFAPVFHEGRQVFVDRLTLFPRGCIAAEVSGRLVAYLISHPWFEDSAVELDTTIQVLPRGVDCLYIHELVVDPKTRGLGLGGRLVAEAIRLARSLCLASITLVAVQESEGFWQRFGFQAKQPAASLETELHSYGHRASYMVLRLVERNHREESAEIQL